MEDLGNINVNIPLSIVELLNLEQRIKEPVEVKKKSPPTGI
jgi:hypothetical protein